MSGQAVLQVWNLAGRSLDVGESLVLVHGGATRPSSCYSSETLPRRTDGTARFSDEAKPLLRRSE